MTNSHSPLYNYYFSHTLQQSNTLAYALAKKARFSFPVLVWMEFVPPYIYKVFVSYYLAIK